MSVEKRKKLGRTREVRHTVRVKRNVLTYTHTKEREMFMLSGRRDAH